MSKYGVEFLTNVLPWTPFELVKQYLILLQETVRLWGKDLLTGIEIGIESELDDIETKSCSVPFKFWKLLSREENYQQIYQELKIYLHYGFYKSSVKLSKELFEDASCFPKCCIVQVARLLLSLHFCEIISLLFLSTFFSEQKLSGI